MKPALILNLPDEVLAKIFKPRPGDLGQDLPAIHGTCKAFQKVVVEEVHLRSRHVLMGPIAQLANKSADRVSGRDGSNLLRHIPLLPLLGGAQRAHLVDCILDRASYRGTYAGIGDLASAIGCMARGVAHLDKPLQAKLVDQAIRFANEDHFVSALQGFGTELAHLDKALCQQLIDKAIGLEGDEHRARAIEVFSTGLAHLNRAQQQALLTATNRISDGAWRDHAISYLCKGLKYLDADDRSILFEKATQLPLGDKQAAAIQNLGGSLESLSRDQRDTLVTSALNMIDQGEDYFKFHAICGLAAGLEHLEPHQMEKLVTASTTRLSVFRVDEAIAALGTSLRHLTDAQQDKLFDAATRLNNDRDKVIAMAGLAAGFASLDTSVRKDQLGDRLVDMALSLSSGTGTDTDTDRAEAIAALGPRLGHLKQDRHEGLVDAAIRVFKAARGPDRRDIRALSAGLGAGFGSLRPELRSKLIDTVTRPQSSDDGRQLHRAAEAIAGLGAGLPHLDEAQCRALLAAAARLYNPRDPMGGTSTALPSRVLPPKR